MKVLIIGGGPAGMIAAITAKKNYPEADVEILEKKDILYKSISTPDEKAYNEFVKNFIS